MNKIVLIGNLTRDPESRTTQGGVSLCSFTIAVDRRFAGADREKQADFFRITAWRQLGDACAKYLAKGRKVAVIGELQARTYDGKDGVTRMALDVSADEVEFLTPKGTHSPETAETAANEPVDVSDLQEIDDEELPF